MELVRSEVKLLRCAAQPGPRRGERLAGAGQPAALRRQRAGARGRAGLATIERGADGAGPVRVAGESVTEAAGGFAVAAMAGGAVG